MHKSQCEKLDQRISELSTEVCYGIGVLVEVKDILPHTAMCYHRVFGNHAMYLVLKMNQAMLTTGVERVENLSLFC